MGARDEGRHLQLLAPETEGRLGLLGWKRREGALRSWRGVSRGGAATGAAGARALASCPLKDSLQPLGGYLDPQPAVAHMAVRLAAATGAGRSVGEGRVQQGQGDASMPGCL